MRPQSVNVVAPGTPGTESRDISVKAVVWTFAGVVTLLIVLGGALVVLERYLFAGGRGDKASLPIDAALPLSGDLPPKPRLELSSSGNRAAMVKDWDARLHAYGRNADGTWHLPIERAMALFAARRLGSPPGSGPEAPKPRQTPPAGGAP
jgi:hypothetical protein